MAVLTVGGKTAKKTICKLFVAIREEDPVAYAFTDALELTEKQINDLESVINKEDDPLSGARRRISENREIVRPWIEAARSAR